MKDVDGVQECALASTVHADNGDERLEECSLYGANANVSVEEIRIACMSPAQRHARISVGEANDPQV